MSCFDSATFWYGLTSKAPYGLIRIADIEFVKRGADGRAGAVRAFSAAQLAEVLVALREYTPTREHELVPPCAVVYCLPWSDEPGGRSVSAPDWAVGFDTNSAWLFERARQQHEATRDPLTRRPTAPG